MRIGGERIKNWTYENNPSLYKTRGRLGAY